MKVLLINQNWFAPELRQAGHEVLSVGFGKHLDISYDAPLTPIQQLLPKGFVPDLLVHHDNSAPVAISGLDDLECPSVFYGVDTHVRLELHNYLSTVFDKTFIAQKDYLEKFVDRGFAKPVWLPLWAPSYQTPSPDKKFGAVFVGTFDAGLNPERIRFFDALKRKVEVTLTSGAYTDYFPFAEVVINQTIRGDLNFRVFETMMCGAALLTERIGNGLTDFFQPGKHLQWYEKGNVEEAAEYIRSMLGNLKRTRELARAGREEVLAHHTTVNRATIFFKELTTLQNTHKKNGHFAWMLNYQKLADCVTDKKSASYTLALNLAIKRLKAGIQKGEKLDDPLAQSALRAAMDYDRVSGSHRGKNLLIELHRLHADNLFLNQAFNSKSIKFRAQAWN